MKDNSSDILFVFAPGPGSGGAFNGHLGVAYLRAALAQHGIATAQYRNANPGTIDAVAADIIRQQSPIVGFTVYDTNARLSIALAASIERQRPEVRIVFGGPTSTFSARGLMERHGSIDACVMGEAEETAPAIFAILLSGGSFDEAQPGVAFRKNGEVVCTPMPPLVGCGKPGVRDVLDAIPSPYLSGMLTDGREGVLTSRGCTHHCQYCCFAALGRQRLRLHSVARVLAELEYIAYQQKRKGQSYSVALVDDSFTLLPDHSKALCRAIADLKLGLVLSCSTRADNVDEELLALMREAGFGSIAFGLESAVPSVLRATGKIRPPNWPDPDLSPERQFLQRVKNSVLLARKYGLSVAVSIVLGLPTETLADGAATLRFVNELRIDSYAHNFLWVFPGTPLWKSHGNYEIDCEVDRNGLALTTGYAYDLRKLKPARKCELQQEATLLRLLAADALSACEAGRLPGTGVNYVVVEADALSDEVADWLRDILTVGGLVVQVYAAPKRKEQFHELCRDRLVLRDHLVPAIRYIQVEPHRPMISGDATWKVAAAGVDVYRRHKPELLRIQTSTGPGSLIAWAKGEQPQADVCEIRDYLQHPAELRQLMGRIEQAKASSPLQGMLTPPQVKYPGRWLRGKAPCASLRRIEVSAQGEVRCCRHGPPIGKIGDSRRTLARRLTQLRKAVEQRRGCAECPNTRCPRCPFPGIDDFTYCQTMCKQTTALRALDWISIYSRLPLLSALPRIR